MVSPSCDQIGEHENWSQKSKVKCHKRCKASTKLVVNFVNIWVVKNEATEDNSKLQKRKDRKGLGGRHKIHHNMHCVLVQLKSLNSAQLQCYVFQLKVAPLESISSGPLPMLKVVKIPLYTTTHVNFVAVDILNRLCIHLHFSY